jgi:serine/threonine protein kinase
MFQVVLRLPPKGTIIPIVDQKCLADVIIIIINIIDWLGDIITEGSFCFVCSAYNLKSDEKIAIKFYKKQENKEANNTIEQEIKVGFDKRLICPYIMTFKNDFAFSNEETGDEFRCVSMELMNCSLESFLKLISNKDTPFPLQALFVTEVSFIYSIYLFCRRFYVF